MKYIYLVEESISFSGNWHIKFSCKTKKLAENICRSQGFVFRKNDNYFESKHMTENNYTYIRRIERIPYYE